MAQQDLLETVRKHLLTCKCDLGLDDDVYEILRFPARELHASLPVRMDDGRIRVFPAFRVQYNDALGPTKGGVRFHPGETAESVRALASLMTWKCALQNLPLGGAKGAVACNPRELSSGELERISRAYVRAFFPLMGPERDVPAPDMYTNQQTMAWMMDEYSRLAGQNVPGAITGKPPVLGGSEGRLDATAIGGCYTIREAAGGIGLGLRSATVAVQGFGNVGYHAAMLVRSQLGCRVVAVSDSRGGIYDSRGLNPEEVQEHKMQTGSVVDFHGADNISNHDLLELDVDVLIPAALEGVITGENASRIRARMVAELANGPTTTEADGVLSQNGVHLIPDILGNGGGVIVSYFEMVQNFSRWYWDEAEVHRLLEKKMVSCYRQVLETSRKMNVNMRQAAYMEAVGRVIQAMKARGWV
ncbi:MAG: Glu/Leu/Phe/Val dehydrogenase [Methanosarcinales archaeon]|nr:Glu/Leu/Phe/Val dehydrogenase [Methanosarcinales archaeon]